MKRYVVKLDVRAMGIAWGVVWSFGVILTGLLAAYTGLGKAFVDIMGSCYIGYTPTLTGSLIGGTWAFVDGGITGALIAFIYNKFASG